MYTLTYRFLVFALASLFNADSTAKNGQKSKNSLITKVFPNIVHWNSSLAIIC